MILLDIVLYSMGGVIGTMHHVYFSGEPAEHMALGAFFSAAEVIPLTFLTVEARTFLQLGAAQQSRSRTPFPHRWAVLFLVSVGFWNFLGAGIFGFLINLPVVSYYEIGTALTANHGHAAMMGVYGMLAIGLALFCLRYLIPAEQVAGAMGPHLVLVDQPRPRLDVLRNLLPLGIAQLYKSVNEGYWEARDLAFLTRTRTRSRVAAPARRHRLHRRRSSARALHRVDRDPSHGQARHRGTGQILFTEIHQARRGWARSAPRRPQRRR